MSLRAQFLQYIAQTSPAPMALQIERGAGLYLYDNTGKKYIDIISGISVSSLGHSHPAVVEAVQKQAAQFMHTLVYGEFVLAPQVELAKALCSELPSMLNSVYFVNSGAEATEGAMKLAKRYTGRKEIISATQAYHGSTQGALSLMSEPYFTEPFRPLLPHIKHIGYNNFCDLEAITEATAAVLIETIKAEAGVELPQACYLRALRERCYQVGCLLILDEIQVGCGRTGKPFAFQHYGIEPDVLLLAKAFGGGMPLGAFVSSKKIMSSLSDNPVLGHITTFGGHPVSAAAALAAWNAMRSEGLIEAIEHKTAIFVQRLQTHKALLDMRFKGFFMALQVRNFEEVQLAIQKCLELGLITDWFLFNDAALRIAPPLNISEEEIHAACDILCQALDFVYSQRA